MARYIGHSGCYITEVNVENPTVEVNPFWGGQEFIQTSDPIVDVRLQLPYSSPVTDLIFESMKMKSPLNIFRTEWRCLYCASPVAAEKTHCPNCGAPRGWLL